MLVEVLLLIFIPILNLKKKIYNIIGFNIGPFLIIDGIVL